MTAAPNNPLVDLVAEAMWDVYRTSPHTPEWKREVTWSEARQLASKYPLWNEAVVKLGRQEAQAALEACHLEEVLTMLESVEAHFRDEAGVFAEAGHKALAEKTRALAEQVAELLARMGAGL